MRRRNILAFIFLLCITFCFAKGSLFEKYEGKEQVISFTLPKSMLQMVPDMDANGIDIKKLKNKVESIQILTTQAQQVRAEMTEDFKNLSSEGYTKLVQGKDQKVDATVWVKEDGEIISEFLVFTDSNNTIAVVRMLGKFTAEDMQQMINQ